MPRQRPFPTDSGRNQCCMYLNDLESQVALGEDSRQFKRDVGHGDALAAEMAAFANSEGGVNYPV